MPSGVSGPTYEIKAEFRNALNLPQGAPVKLNGNRVGTVQEITAHDYVADVTLRVRKDTPIPRGTRAEVRTTAPMGEAYVELTPPADTTRAVALVDGDRLPLSSTATAPDVSDLLVALSATVTGGPFADISTIIKQLNIALDGRTGDVHDLLARLDTLVSGLNAHTDDIDRVLDGMDRLGGALAGDAPSLSRAIDDLTPAITTLRGQRAALMKMLGRITRVEHGQPPRHQRHQGVAGQPGQRGRSRAVDADRQHGQDAPPDAGRHRLRQRAGRRIPRRLRAFRPHHAARARRPLQPPGPLGPAQAGQARVAHAHPADAGVFPACPACPASSGGTSAAGPSASATSSGGGR